MESQRLIIATSPELVGKLMPAAAALKLGIECKTDPNLIMNLHPLVVVAEASVPAELNIMHSLRQSESSITRMLAFSTQAIPLNVMIAMRLGHRFIDLTRDSAEIASIIADAAHITKLFAAPALQNSVRALAFLPRLPDLFTEVEAAVHAPGASLSKAAQIIERDQAVTGHLLKLVNAAAFAGNRPITRVEDAVTRIGINNLKALIIAVTFFSKRIKNGDGPDFNTLNWHAFSVARAARLIAQHADLPNWSQDMLFLAGLLHDLGSLVLITAHGEEYAKLLLKAQQDGGGMLELEEQAFGINHAMLGGYISRLWGFPDIVSELIMEHHHSDKEDISFEIINAADAIGQKLLYRNKGEGVSVQKPPRPEWVKLCSGIISEVLTEMAEKKRML